MKDEQKARQGFNTTLTITIIIAAILAFGLLGLFYGCMKANHAPHLKKVSQDFSYPVAFEV
jgi:hypothetical protein